MTTQIIHIPLVGLGVLTTDHAASSYGKPVFVRHSDGAVFGSADIAPGSSLSSCKAMALASSQYTGAAEEPWPVDICRAIEAW